MTWDSPKLHWLRWTIILPTCFLVYLICYGLLMVLNWLTVKFYYSSEGDGGWMTLYIWPAIASGLAANYFVVWGVFMAPSYKKIVAMILMVLLCVISGVWLFAVLQLGNYAHVIAVVSQIIGAVVGYYNCKELIKEE